MTQSNMPASAADSSPLISPECLHDWLADDSDVTVLDVRWSLTDGACRSAYENGHIPSAQFIDLETELSAEPGTTGRHPLPAPGVFVDAMRRAGINDTTAVVCYDAKTGTSAARAWWLLRYFGHQHVYVLDGGLAGWQRAGYRTVVSHPDAEPGNFSIRESRARTLEAPAVLGFAADHVLLDARDDERYRGDIEPVDAVAGHIPGAQSAPTKNNLADDGTFLPATELRRRFERLGAGPGSNVATYCGSGVTAAHQILALEVAGIHAALYPGSWSEWITDPSRPIATGPFP